jgi:hypothetical protein
MAETNYVITRDDGFAAQLQTFKNTIGGYAAMPVHRRAHCGMDTMSLKPRFS